MTQTGKTDNIDQIDQRYPIADICLGLRHLLIPKFHLGTTCTTDMGGRLYASKLWLSTKNKKKYFTDLLISVSHRFVLLKPCSDLHHPHLTTPVFCRGWQTCPIDPHNVGFSRQKGQ